MSQPWSAEHAVTIELARELIEGQFPALAPAQVEPLGTGWDNTALLINSRLVFRFPRREIAVDCLRAELHVLPYVSRRLPLPIPTPEWIGRLDFGYPWPFASYVSIPGRTACGAAMTEDHRMTSAPVLGKFLRQLHAIPMDEARKCTLAVQPSIWPLHTASFLPPLIERFARRMGRSMIRCGSWDVFARCTTMRGLRPTRMKSATRSSSVRV